MHFDQEFGLGAYGIAHRFHQRYSPDLLAVLKLVKACTKWVSFESAIRLLDHPPGSPVKFLWSPFDSVSTIRISFDTITHCTAEELIARWTKGVLYNIPAANLDRCDGGHGNF